ncbi:MAG: ParB/RepB/Spo0J family partition protein [Methylococcaceae bacterium]|nr:ParB/RepB/Spo0J family partition protein [Methylococcaceae bacterium]
MQKPKKKELLDLDLSLIDEDPLQPRRDDNPGFSEEKLNELATSIRRRGVKTPISVHQHPDKPGRFIINHGARRFRASKLAGKTTVPAHIDNDYTRTDQLTENLLREGNTPMEIAKAIDDFLKKGMKKKDIAENIGKTPGYVTQYASLLKLPKSIATAFHDNRITDVTLIYELVQLHREHPDDIDTWVSDDNQEFTRGSMKYLRHYLNQKAEDSERDSDLGGESDLVETNQTNPGQDTHYDTPDHTVSPHHADTAEEHSLESFSGSKNTRHPGNQSLLNKVIVKVLHNNRTARLMLERSPSVKGYAWLQYDADGFEFEATLRDVQLMAIEGEW